MPNIFFLTQLSAHWHNATRHVILDTHPDALTHFLHIWSAWRTDPARPAQLHVLALVGPTFSIDSLQTACFQAPALQPLNDKLCAVLPRALPGFHRLLLNDEHVVLTLIIGDAETCLPQIQAQVNTFILHEQAGSHAPKICSRLAAAHAILFSDAASAITRQALTQAGFIAEPVTSSTSVTSTTSVTANTSTTSHTTLFFHARFAPRWTPPPSPHAPERRAIIIGAGLAGSAVCERLAARGWQLTLIERHAQPAQEASGNLAGIFMPLLSKDDNATARLTRAAYLFATQLWQRIGGIGAAFAGEACGVLQLARDAEHAQAQQAMIASGSYPPDFVQWLTTAAAAELCGTPVPNGGWHFPQAGWAQPAAVCRALLAACGDQVTTCFNQSALQLVRSKDQAHEHWQVRGANGELIAQAPVVILANGTDALQFSQTQDLPLTAVRGQVTYVAADALPDLPLVVCRDGYVTPPLQGLCSVGASYDLQSDTTPSRILDDENCARLQDMLPAIAINLNQVPHQNRVAFRCVAPDRMPLVGALPDAHAASRAERLRDVPRLPGLYGLLGYASRGLIWSSLAAELLAAQLEGEPLPIENDLVEALDPARFLLKARKKG